MRKILLLLTIILTVTKLLAQIPTITSVTKTSSTLTINGTNFGTTPTSNIVYIGDVKTSIVSSTATKIRIALPLTAAQTYKPISVTVNGLTAYYFSNLLLTQNTISTKYYSFAAPYAVDTVLGIETTDIATGDFDNDNKIDIAVVDRLNDSVTIYKNTTIGNTISFGSKISYKTGHTPRCIKVADINGDGKQDIVVGNQNDSSISVFVNSSSTNISFNNQINIRVGQYPNDIAIADFNKDGKLDIATANLDLYGNISILKNTGTTSTIQFSAFINQSLGGVINSITANDFNGDGLFDIAVANETYNEVRVLKNTSSAGNISFINAATVAAGTQPESIISADFNGDNLPDIAVSNWQSANISTIQNTTVSGTISFGSSVNYTSYIHPNALAVGDFVPDGYPEILSVSNATGFNVFSNNATANIGFNNAYSRPYPSTSLKSAIADFDNDGRNDMAITSFALRVNIYQNTNNGRPIITDFNPKYGKTGDTIIISGHNFKLGTFVKISLGGDTVSSYKVRNDSTIRVNVGVGSTGDVVVVNDYGEDRMAGFTYTGIKNVSVDSIVPAKARLRDTIFLYGKNLDIVTDIKVGGVSCFKTYSSSNVVGLLLNGNITSSLIEILYSNKVDSIYTFNFMPPPSITSFNPLYGGGKSNDTITITGDNFIKITKVQFGGFDAKYFKVNNTGEIKAIADTLGTGSVRVYSNQYNEGSITGFTAKPVIKDFNPKIAGKDSSITINGYNLKNVQSIKLNGFELMPYINCNNDFVICGVAQYLSKSSSGRIVVETVAGKDSIDGFTFVETPIIKSFSPISGGSGSFVDIKGQKFNSVSKVVLAYYSAGYKSFQIPFSLVSDSLIKITIPSYLRDTIKDNKVDISISLYSIGGIPAANFIYTNNPIINQLSSFCDTIGAIVTITGANFDATSSKNHVFFGGVKATVISATTNELKVKVPKGAAHDFISIACGFKYCYSSQKFLPTSNLKSFLTSNSFAKKVDFVTGDKPYDIATGDIDGDGKLDIVVANYNDKNINIFYNKSTVDSISFIGGFTLTLNRNVKVVKVFDINNDGKLDIAIVSGNQGYYDTTTFLVQKRNVNGVQFENPIEFANQTAFTTNMVKIPTEDGKSQIASYESYTFYNNHYSSSLNTIKDYSKDSNTNFIDGYIDYYKWGSYPYLISLMDYNNDGFMNFIVQTYGSGGGYSAIYKDYSNQELISIPYSFMGSSYIADFDGDGICDYSLTNLSGYYSIYKYSNITNVFDETKNHAFQNFGSINASAFTGNKKMDLAFLSDSKNLIFNQNRSSLNQFIFQKPITINIDEDSTLKTQYISADVNSDGKDDIIYLTNKKNQFSVLLNLMAEAKIDSSSPSNNGIEYNTSIKDSAVCSYSNLPYLQRHYFIKSKQKNNNLNKVTLYFTQEDFNNYNNELNKKNSLPIDSLDSNGISNIRVYFYRDTLLSNVPGGSYDSSFEINPIDSNIKWNTNGEYWSITINSNGLGRYFISSADSSFFANLPTISGNLISPKSKSIKNVLLKQNTNGVPASIIESNTYSIKLENNSNISIRPTKNNDITKANGVTSIDALLTQRHILNTTKLNSAYKLIAADVDGNKAINSVDVLRMKRLILGTDTTFTKTVGTTKTDRLWEFVDSAYTFPDTTNPFPFKDSISFTNLTSNKTNQTFIGVKLGDVNYDWNAAVARQMPVNSLELIVDRKEQASTVHYTLSTINFRDLAAMQYTLHFDNTKYEFVGIENNKLGIDFNSTQANKTGNIAMLWTDKNAQSQTLEDGSELFTLVLRAKGFGTSNLELGINNDIADIEAWDNDYKKHNIILSQKLKVETQNSNDVWSVSPNPTKGEIKVNMVTQSNKVVVFELANAQGKTLLQQSFDATKGNNTFNLNLKKKYNIPTGLYFLKVKGVDGEQVKKVIVE